MATYTTEIQWGGPNAPWHQDHDLQIVIGNREQVVGDGPPATGTSVTWSGPNGNGTVTFYDDGKTFSGNAQFPSEGPVGYRGTLST
ncbi:MAG TPA: hypothetical protein VGD67_21515 [Pseudonocardiaceae bacterium]